MERSETRDGMREGDEERTKKMDTNVGLKRFVHLSLSGLLAVLPFSVIERYLFVLLRHPHRLLLPICIIPLHYPK